MFERFTDRARRVVTLSLEEARLLHHNYIGTEHLLAALVHEGEGVAAIVLSEFGLTSEAVRTQIKTIIGEGKGPEPEGHIAFTPRVKKVLENSLYEAVQLNHDYIGTEHLLLSLVAEGEGVGAQILALYQIDLLAVHGRTLDVLGHYLGAEKIRREVALEEQQRSEITETDEGLRLMLEHERFTNDWGARMAEYIARRPGQEYTETVEQAATIETLKDMQAMLVGTSNSLTIALENQLVFNKRFALLLPAEPDQDDDGGHGGNADTTPSDEGGLGAWSQ